MARAVRSTVAAEAAEVVQGAATSRTAAPKRPWKMKALLALVILGLAAGVGYSQYKIYQLTNAEYQQKMAEKTTQKTIDKVRELMELPDETPQIAVVQDVDKLKESQAFFTKAENGDLVLIYSQIAVIYSESKNKIINVGPIQRDESAPVEASPAPAPEENSAATKETKPAEEVTEETPKEKPATTEQN